MPSELLCGRLSLRFPVWLSASEQYCHDADKSGPSDYATEDRLAVDAQVDCTCQKCQGQSYSSSKPCHAFNENEGVSSSCRLSSELSLELGLVNHPVDQVWAKLLKLF